LFLKNNTKKFEAEQATESFRRKCDARLAVHFGGESDGTVLR
jgi:hypothetical protein